MSEDILNKFKKIHEEKKSTDTGKAVSYTHLCSIICHERSFLSFV